MRLSPRRTQLLFCIFAVYLVVVKFTAIRELGFLGDEPDDYKIIRRDLRSISSFFEESYAHDQARLPHLVSIPVILLFKKGSLLAVRLLYIGIHVIYLWLFYRMMRLKFPDSQALYCTVLVGSSAFLASFSIFAMTSSNNLFLLGIVAALYYYLRHLESATERVPERVFVIFPLLLGLCVASRLWGVFVLVSIFVYDLVLRIRERRLISTRPEGLRLVSLSLLNTLFTLSIAVQNLLPWPPRERLVLSLVLAGLYLVGMGILWARGRSTVFMSFPWRWSLIVHGAFNFTLVLSPNYMNFANIVAIFDWHRIWNVSDVLINPNPLDIIYIVLVKFGAFNTVVLVLAMLVMYRSKELGLFVKSCSLFLLFSAVNAVFLLIPEFVVTWYPISVFQFLYLPISALITYLPRISRRFVYAGLLVLCVALPAHEQVRYLRLWPYGHLDGYQYGEEFIGWSKPGFVTFEGIPLLYNHLASRSEQELTTVIVCAVPSRMYNRYAAEALNAHFTRRGLQRYFFLSYYDLFSPDHPLQVLRRHRGLVVTSNYTPAEIVTELETTARELHRFKVLDLVVARLWELGPAAPKELEGQ
jgi:hypothetical protein